ncbi:MAG: CADD family putative folate metabolism protein [Candidatus Binataceae bacterium]
MAREIIAELDSIVAKRSLLSHPFYQAWTAGELSRERLQEYAVQYYPHVAAFPRYLSAIHSRCAEIETRQALLENLIEEERGAENHPELWLRFAEGLGVARERVFDTAKVAASRGLVRIYEQLCGAGPIAAGLAALYVYEAQIPAVATAKIDGLRRFYGITGDRAVEFFRVHEQADVYHARAGAELIERHAEEDDARSAALESGRRALEALWSMLDAV